MTIKEATELWVHRDMNYIPYSVLGKLRQLDPNDVREITPICKGDRVYVCSVSQYGYVTSISDDLYTVELDDDETVEVEENDLESDFDGEFPMWNTLWTFNDPCDEAWAEEHLFVMAECGFRLYESEDYGLVFGIDGAGYDFYSEHWIPLYKARGLHWHDDADEEEYQMTQKKYVKRKMGSKIYWMDGDTIIKEAHV